MWSFNGLQVSSWQQGGALTFALQVRPGGFEDRQEDGEQLHQVSGDVARRRLVVHHVQSVEGLQDRRTQSIPLQQPQNVQLPLEQTASSYTDVSNF